MSAASFCIDSLVQDQERDSKKEATVTTLTLISVDVARLRMIEAQTKETADPNFSKR